MWNTSLDEKKHQTILNHSISALLWIIRVNVVVNNESLNTEHTVPFKVDEQRTFNWKKIAIFSFKIVQLQSLITHDGCFFRNKSIFSNILLIFHIIYCQMFIYFFSLLFGRNLKCSQFSWINSPFARWSLFFNSIDCFVDISWKYYSFFFLSNDTQGKMHRGSQYEFMAEWCTFVLGVLVLYRSHKSFEFAYEPPAI